MSSTPFFALPLFFDIRKVQEGGTGPLISSPPPPPSLTLYPPARATAKRAPNGILFPGSRVPGLSSPSPLYPPAYAEGEKPKRAGPKKHVPLLPPFSLPPPQSARNPEKGETITAGIGRSAPCHEKTYSISLFSRAWTMIRRKDREGPSLPFRRDPFPPSPPLFSLAATEHMEGGEFKTPRSPDKTPDHYTFFPTPLPLCQRAAQSQAAAARKTDDRYLPSLSPALKPRQKGSGVKKAAAPFFRPRVRRSHLRPRTPRRTFSPFLPRKAGQRLAGISEKEIRQCFPARSSLFFFMLEIAREFGRKTPTASL